MDTATDWNTGARSAPGKEKMKRIITIFLTFLILAIATVLQHEAFHLLTAQALGYDGRLELWTFPTMYFIPNIPYPTGWHEAAIGLSGGIGTGIVLLGFWALTSRNRTHSEIDNGMPMMSLGIGQIIYAPFDAFWSSAISLGASGGVVIGIVISSLWYSRPLIDMIRKLR